VDEGVPVVGENTNNGAEAYAPGHKEMEKEKATFKK
jgi:hypothetical protein